MYFVFFARKTDDIDLGDQNEGTGYEVTDFNVANSWNNITPGVHSLSEVESVFGTKLDSIKMSQGYTKTDYDWRGPGMPVTVITDYKQVIQYLRVPLFETYKGIMDEYINQWELGQPDIVKYTVEAEEVKMYVYLNDGIAFEASEGKEVYHIIFFNPTSQDEFLKIWGPRLTDSPEVGDKKRLIPSGVTR